MASPSLLAHVLVSKYCDLSLTDNKLAQGRGYEVATCRSRKFNPVGFAR
jgi:hypothetical protein